jgi:uncharacterized tellurite resistance protein B-like protein
VLDHLDVAVTMTEARLARAKAESDDTSREGMLAFIVRDTAEELEGEVEVELNALFDKKRNKGEKLHYRFDPTVTRAFAYAIPVLAAAKLWKRSLNDERRGAEAVHLIARTAVWLLGRSPLPELPALSRGTATGDWRSEESLTQACRIAGMWLGRSSLAKAIPSSFGEILAHGTDYFGMSACAAVADHYYDDFQLTLEESLEVARDTLNFKLALVAALVRTARADGRFAFEEEEMLRLFLDNLAFSDDEKSHCLSQAGGGRSPSTDALARVKLPAHREFIIARAVEMAFADRHETRPEKLMVRQLARTLGVPESHVRAHEATMRALNRTISGE